MKLVYKQITRLNQWFWFWSDGFGFETEWFRNQDEALNYGIEKGYIDTIPMYPEYDCLYV
jgi:hypothetical protein